MRKVALLFVALVLALAGASAQERVDLTVPITKTSTQNCQLDDLRFSNLSKAAAERVIEAKLICNNDDLVTKTYTGATNPTAASLLTTLNTANNSGANPSFIKRVYNRLIADGVIVGTVSGTPQ